MAQFPKFVKNKNMPDTKGKNKATSSPPRLTIEIDDTQKVLLEEYIPWGIRRRVLSFIVDDLIRILHDEKDRQLILGALLTRNVKLEDFLQLDENKDG